MMTIWSIFATFAKIGVIGYGGGNAMVPLIEVEAVDMHKWMTLKEFTDSVAVGYALPGPIAPKLAWWVGVKVAGIGGGIAALIGVLGPSLIGMALIFYFFLNFKDAPWVKGMTRAVAPVVLVLLALLVWDMGTSTLTDWRMVFIAGVALVGIRWLHIHPAFLVLAALSFGAFLMRP